MKSLRPLNNHFLETVEKLNTFKWPSNEKHENIHNEKLTTMIKKTENHPSITKIKIKYAYKKRLLQNQLQLKMLEISLKIHQITKHLEEKCLLTLLSNIDLLIIKC